MAQKVTAGSTTTTTRHLAGGLEDVTISGSTTTLTKYEAVPGVASVVISGSGPGETVSYLATDGLGSVSEALSSSGTVTATQLYGPYGSVRYSSGTLPTAKGYTGQYADGMSSGLDYYRARYYDAVAGRFVQRDPLGRAPLFWDSQPYAYAGNNPLVNVDPSGQRYYDGDDESAQQQIQETRRTQRVARAAPRRPAHPATHPQTKTNSPKPPAPKSLCNQGCQAGMQQRSRLDQANALGGIKAFLGDLRAHMSFWNFLSNFGQWVAITGAILAAIAVFVGSVILAITTIETVAGFIVAADAAVLALDGLVHAIGAAVSLVYGDHSSQYLNYVGGIQATADLFTMLIGVLSFLILTGGTGLDLGVTGGALLGSQAVVGGGALGGLFLWIQDIVSAGLGHMAFPF